jgi:small GTP-binding protein
LTKLTELRLDGNDDLTSPPPGVVKQGTQAILAYMREQLKKRKEQWISKLMVVGEGGVGKTSLLRALRGKRFVEGLETTHGIGVEKLELAHPNRAGVTIELNTWDFGGQQIYHATHQFFLTNRSLFVLVWDARHGWEAGKLYGWLDRIQAKAPESPVMIVAAHIDERDADLPLDDLQRKYPQIKGHYKISNKNGTGIGDFRQRLAEVAADLPLMGEEWPASWLDAANEIRAREEHHIWPRDMFTVMERHKVEGEAATVLAGWLHELGGILYFKEDDELNDTVILNPAWVTDAISDVLESKEVVEKDGVLTRENRDKLWTDVHKSVREHFLRLMERFDLSYRRTGRWRTGR